MAGKKGQNVKSLVALVLPSERPARVRSTRRGTSTNHSWEDFFGKDQRKIGKKKRPNHSAILGKRKKGVGDLCGPSN